MPSVRFSRDKRGYEHTYLVHESGGRGRPGRMRVLYWFRTPPGIKVGRQPFDDEARRQIEARNPGVAFDWETIASTPMPPVPEVEHWRERRRVEKAAKVARREEEQEAERDEDDAEAPAVLLVAEPVALDAAAASVEADEPVPQTSTPGSTPSADPAPPRKRRRRRGGRRRNTGTEAAGSLVVDADSEAEDDGEAAASAESTAAVGWPETVPDRSAVHEVVVEAESTPISPADPGPEGSNE